APATALTLGKAVGGTLTNPGDQATYTFAAAAGQRVYFDGLGSSVFGLRAALADPNGTAVFDVAASADAGPYNLARAGTYALTVHSQSTTRATGGYAFALDDAAAAAPIALTPGGGTTVGHALAPGSATDLYRISGSAGERVYFEELSDSPAFAAYA